MLRARAAAAIRRSAWGRGERRRRRRRREEAEEGGRGLWQPGGEPEPVMPEPVPVVAVPLLLLPLPRRITQVEMARFGAAFQPLRHPVAGTAQGSPLLLSC